MLKKRNMFLQSSASLDRQMSQSSIEEVNASQPPAEKYNPNSGFLERQIKSIVVDDSKEMQIAKAMREKEALGQRGIRNSSFHSPGLKPHVKRQLEPATLRVRGLNKDIAAEHSNDYVPENNAF